MPKSSSRGDSGLTQLCLPSMRLQDFVLALSVRCECLCVGCPPWVHYRADCDGACRSVGVPPVCNTGVHDSRKRGASGGESSVSEVIGE
jgi:hypothetical protein